MKVPIIISLNELKEISRESMVFFQGDTNTPPCAFYKGLDQKIFQSGKFREVKVGEKDAEANPNT